MPVHRTPCPHPRRLPVPANRAFVVFDDEPILPAAIRQGIGLPYGCRDGACGSCKS
ncbi:MAG: 2Fe-2S iron-sulfur cluster binding domain-containing protein, partial [Rubrivivax sp.]|nr:2Fe-2S iron-sulfur cluster binding domain-containing protein [Rubrivivax sp.]